MIREKNLIAIIKSLNAIKVLFVSAISITLPVLTIILLNPLFLGTESRSLDSAFSNISKAILVFFISLVVGIISILTLKEKLLRLLLNSFTILLLIEIVFLIVANLNNWWRT